MGLKNLCEYIHKLKLPNLKEHKQTQHVFIYVPLTKRIKSFDHQMFGAYSDLKKLLYAKKFNYFHKFDYSMDI